MIEDSTLEDVYIDIQRFSKNERTTVSFDGCHLVRVNIALSYGVTATFRNCRIDGDVVIVRDGPWETIPNGIHSELTF